VEKLEEFTHWNFIWKNFAISFKVIIYYH
jgi:hypothetical protein